MLVYSEKPIFTLILCFILMFLNNYIAFLIYNFSKYFFKVGIGDWGLGIGDWGLGPIPNPPSPIPNPQSPRVNL